MAVCSLSCTVMTPGSYEDWMRHCLYTGSKNERCYINNTLQALETNVKKLQKCFDYWTLRQSKCLAHQSA